MEAWIDLYMVCFDSTEQPEWLHVQIATGSILGFVRTGGQGPVEIVVKDDLQKGRMGDHLRNLRNRGARAYYLAALEFDL